MKIRRTGCRPGLARSVLASAGIPLSLCLGHTALAQQPQQPTEETPQELIEEIQVTGSRIARSGFNTPTPVTVVSGAELDNMAPGDLIESVSLLPQFYNNETPDTAVGGQNASGSIVNLRGAGTSRTLTLLGGRRVVPSNRFGVTDIGTFPQLLIRSVETVTGGASASYGTDAVAGVVNFLLDTEFTGFEANAQYGETSRGYGETYEVGLAFGTGITDRLHVIGSVETYNREPIRSNLDAEALRDHPYFQQWARVTNPDPNGPTQLVRRFVSPTNFTSNGIINQPGSSLDKVEFLPNGQVRPLSFSGVGAVNAGCNCQAEPVQTFGVDRDQEIAQSSERTSAFVHLDYDIGASFNVYAQHLFGNTRAGNRRESIHLLGPWGARVFADNPFLPPDVRQTMAAEGLDSVGFGMLLENTPETVLGQSELRVNNDMNSTTVGFQGQLPSGRFLSDWQVSGYYQLGRNEQRIFNPAGIRVDRLPMAMDVVEDEFGRPVCRVTLFNPDVFDECVPINLFGGHANITEEMARWVVDDGKTTWQDTRQHVVELLFTGQVANGFAPGPIGAAFGASWREQRLDQATLDPSDEFPALPNGVLLSDLGVHPEGLRGVLPEDQPGGIPGLRHVPPGFAGDANSSSVLFTSLRAFGGKFDVSEVFGEMSVPILAGSSYAEDVTVDVAARWANYSGSGTVWAWKYGLSWQIVNDLRLRATGSRDTRAATLLERFDQTRGGTTVQDPENAFETINTASFSGGNPNVNPEKSDTFTVGAIYQPSLLPGLSLSADWYNIDVEDAIAQLSSQRVVQRCFEGDESLCQFVHRDPQTNRIVRVDNLFINFANQTIRGVDLELGYGRDLRLIGGQPESLNWRLFGTWLDENSFDSPEAPPDDRVGDVGGESLPEYKLTSNLAYTFGPLSVFVQGRYIDSGLLDRALTEGVDIDDNTIPSVFYTDANVSYAGTLPNDRMTWEAFFHVTNLFDRLPPPTPGVVGRTGTNEFNSTLYDVFGRRFTAGLRFNF